MKTTVTYPPLFIMIADLCRMKFLAIFMTLFMLASGFDFCTDLDSSDTGLATLRTNDKQAIPELCSPFCQCAQCPFSALIPAPLMETTEIYSIPAGFVYPSVGDPIRMDRFIWQPPRAS